MFCPKYTREKGAEPEAESVVKQEEELDREGLLHQCSVAMELVATPRKYHKVRYLSIHKHKQKRGKKLCMLCHGQNKNGCMVIAALLRTGRADV